eukprot:366119-Chlamydomonas_euryale.AAC.36
MSGFGAMRLSMLAGLCARARHAACVCEQGRMHAPPGRAPRGREQGKGGRLRLRLSISRSWPCARTARPRRRGLQGGVVKEGGYRRWVGAGKWASPGGTLYQ